MARYFAFGEAMLRLSPPAGGRLQDAATLCAHPAGSEVNVAVALASLGEDAVWLSALPDSPLGRRIAGEVAAAGVDVSRVRWIRDARLGLFFVELGPAPRGVAVLYDRATSAFALEAKADVGEISEDDWFIVSGVTVALGGRPRSEVQAALATVRERGGRVCVDVNYRSRLWKPGEARERLGDMVSNADVVVCSRRDAQTVFGLTGSPEQVIVELREAVAHHATATILTCGEAGALGIDASGLRFQEVYGATVVDRLGVGDAFVAGLLWGLERGSLDRALDAASALAALKCTVPGDFARFRPEEVERVVSDSSNVPLR